MKRRYYIDADMVIEVIEKHKDMMSKGGSNDWRYELAHDHIVDLVRVLKEKRSIPVDVPD